MNMSLKASSSVGNTTMIRSTLEVFLSVVMLPVALILIIVGVTSTPFGGAWTITKEPFMKPFKWLNMLKLKASFGQQGNDNIGDFHYLDTYSIVNTNNKVGLVLSEKGNPNITWETNNNFNAGFDFELFNSRLRGSIEYFYKKTTDMLCFVFAPYSAGYKGTYDNIGDMTNKGVEVDLSATVLKTKNISWDVNVNATTYKNEIIKLADVLKADLVVDGHPGYSSGERIYAEGLPIYEWYMLVMLVYLMKESLCGTTLIPMEHLRRQMSMVMRAITHVEVHTQISMVALEQR